MVKARLPYFYAQKRPRRSHAVAEFISSQRGLARASDSLAPAQPPGCHLVGDAVLELAGNDVSHQIGSIVRRRCGNVTSACHVGFSTVEPTNRLTLAITAPNTPLCHGVQKEPRPFVVRQKLAQRAILTSSDSTPRRITARPASDDKWALADSCAFRCVLQAR